MTFSEWIEGEKGRAASLASHIGVTPAAVSQWKGFGVPLRHMVKVRDFSGGVVTLEEMLPRTQRPARMTPADRITA